jgi:hypothetical protein
VSAERLFESEWGLVMRTMTGVVLALALPSLALAHGGGLNAEGCHNDRKAGEYHCHRGGSAPKRAHPPGPANQLAPAPRRMRESRAFANCDEARAAGAAPVRRGDPRYGPHLDRDKDGVGCEP